MGKGNWKGFTLVELLLYMTIFIVVSGFFIGILNIVGQTQIQESSETEVANQLNFVTATVQRLIRESSAVIVNDGLDCYRGTNDTPGQPKNCLTLRMSDIARNPTCIVSTGGAIVMAGPAADKKSCDQSNLSYLTTNKVIVGATPFTKITNYPGHDTIQMDFTFTLNANQSIAKRILAATSRASAATFDDSLLPGATGQSIGQTNALPSTALTWSRIFLNDGSAGAPAYGFGLEPGADTGIYRAGDGVLRFSTDGADRLEIDANGNVKTIGNYLQIKANSSAPATANTGCSLTSDLGKIYLDASGNNLYVCSNTAAPIWKKVPLGVF